LTVPTSGAGLYDLHTAVRPTFDGPTSGDTDYHVLRNGHELFGQFLEANAGTTYSNLLTLAAGDTIDFVVGRGADDLVDHSSLKVQATLHRWTDGPPPPAPSTNCVPTPAGLVGWWRGEGTAADALGRHPGTVVGEVSFAPGMVGQGFHFDGSGGYVRIPNAPAMGFPSELTIELWYKHEGLPDEAYGLMSARGTETGPVNFGISVIPIGIGPYFNDPAVATGDDADQGGTFEASRYVPVPSSDEFHHLAVSFRQTSDNQVELKTFIDGVLVRTKQLPAQLSAAVSDAAIVIGRSAEYGGEIFHGVIDEVSLYRRALGADEIRGIAAARQHGKCSGAEALPWEALRALLDTTPAPVNTEALQTKLDAAAASLAQGNVRAAIRQLHSFQRQVRRLVAPTAPGLAQQLLQLTQQLIESLDPRGLRREELAVLESLPPRILRLVRLEQGLRIVSCAPPGCVGRLERSSNLRDWTAAGLAVEVSDGLQQCLELQPDPTASFYRFVVASEE
jgi:hypothetical protein